MPSPAAVDQDGSSRPHPRNLARREVRKARRSNIPNFGDRALLTPEQRRRQSEITFLNLRQEILPHDLLVQYRALFNRRAELLPDEDARYQHDIARHSAVERSIWERIEEGIDHKTDEDIWHTLVKIDRATWVEKEQEHVQWINKELGRKCQPKFNKGFNKTIEGHLAACRDLLHVTLPLDNCGGIPEAAVPWLRNCLSKDKASKRHSSAHIHTSWKLAVNHALNYIAACRRESNVNGRFEHMLQHRGHEMEVDTALKKDDLEAEEWICRDEDGFDNGGMLTLSKRKSASQEKLFGGANIDEKAEKDVDDDDVDEEGGVPVGSMNVHKDNTIVSESKLAEDFTRLEMDDME
ncbi:MAG: hypothetical protein Q9191_001277 [Dirinaria sp. TL-2023a]